MVTSGGGRGSIGVGKWEVQATGYKIGSGMYCTTQETGPITCKNCTWKVTFKHWIKSILKIIIKKQTNTQKELSWSDNILR